MRSLVPKLLTAAVVLAAVRAVADGAADPTPAERAFKVLRVPRHSRYR